MRAARVLVLVSLAGVLLASCSDDESISKDDFLEQANEICAEGSEELEEATADLDFEDEEEATEFLEGEFRDNIQGQIDDIRDLGFPEGDEDELDEMLNDAEDALDDLVADPEAAFSEEGEDPFADVNERLVDYGLEECGSE